MSAAPAIEGAAPLSEGQRVDGRPERRQTVLEEGPIRAPEDARAPGARASRWLVAAAITGGLMWNPRPALAGCTITTVSGLTFGAYDVFTAFPTDTSGTIGVSCTLAASIIVDLGAGGSGSFTARTLGGPGGSLLIYNLFLDAARLLVWGDGSTGSLRYGPVLVGTTASLTVYGRITARQDVRAGGYTDSVTVTVNF